MNDDDLDFASLVPDVTRHHYEARAVPAKPRPDKASVSRRQAAATTVQAAAAGLATEYAPPVSGLDEISFRRPGVQHGVFKKLRQGQYPTEATLDLHYKTVAQARQELVQFIRKAHKLGQRSLLINHGKALQGDSGYATIKSYVNHWLPQLEAVLAFHSAQPQHGGTGAVYVMLKKGEQQKQAARERFSRRGE